MYKRLFGGVYRLYYHVGFKYILRLQKEDLIVQIGILTLYHLMKYTVISYKFNAEFLASTAAFFAINL